VRDLLGDAFELEIERDVSPLRMPSGEAYWQLFSTSYGPTRTLAETLDEERGEELHRSWVEFMDAALAEDGEIVHAREWILVLGTRR
jgi:hypothetical protein